MRRDFEFQQISANSGKIPANLGQNLVKFDKHWQKIAKFSAVFRQKLRVESSNLEPCTDSLELCRRVLHLRKSEQRKFGYQQTRPNGTLVLSSYPNYIRRLVTRPLFRSRARVALGSELRLLMSFSWPVFPGLDQVLFPPWFSSFFGIRFQNGAKECIV